MQDECYAIMFRKKLYSNLQDIQTDVDAWIETYNRHRPHSGKYCYGKTPMQTFLSTIPLAKEKNLSTRGLLSDNTINQFIAVS